MMSKQTGLGDNLYIDGFDVSGDIGSIGSIHGGPAALEVTGIDKSGFERVGGERDGAIDYSAWFNDAATPPVGAHFVLSPLTTVDRIVTYCRGTALGSPSACIVAKQTNYDPTRSQDGALSWSITKPANGFGLEWGRLLTAGKRTDGSATNGTGVDFAAASVFGLQAYLQVFAFTGTSVTVKIQESSNDGAGDAYADVVGGTFTAATGITKERIATATGLSVERYLRVVTTGTFSNAVFAVTVVRNETLAAF
jgi:hypothetical protein